MPRASQVESLEELARAVRKPRFCDALVARLQLKPNGAKAEGLMEVIAERHAAHHAAELEDMRAEHEALMEEDLAWHDEKLNAVHNQVKDLRHQHEELGTKHAQAVAAHAEAVAAHDAAVEKGPMLGLFFVLAFIEITTCARNARARSSPNHSRAGRTAHTLHTPAASGGRRNEYAHGERADKARRRRSSVAAGGGSRRRRREADR